MDVVLALGFDLFFKPKLAAAAKEAGVEVRYAGGSEGVARVVADVSVAGVQEQLAALRAARPELPILACFPHVEVSRADAVRALGGPVVAVTRGRFAERMVDALRGTLR